MPGHRRRLLDLSIGKRSQMLRQMMLFAAMLLWIASGFQTYGEPMPSTSTKGKLVPTMQPTLPARNHAKGEVMIPPESVAPKSQQDTGLELAPVLRKSLWTRGLIALLACVLCAPLLAMAEPPPPPDGEETPKDTELEQLKREKEIEKLKTEIEEEKRKRLRDALPKSETKALDGKTTVTELALPGQILAYSSASQVAKRLATDLQAAEPKMVAGSTLIIYSEREFGSVAAFHAVKGQIEAMQEGYENSLPQAEMLAFSALPAALLAPEVATTLLKSVADLMALFRTETEIKGFAVTVEELAVVSELARALPKAPTLTVIYTPAYLPVSFLANPQNSDLVRKLSLVQRSRRRAGEIVAGFERLSEEDKKKHPLKDKIPILKALNEQTDKLSSALSTVDEKTGLNLLTVLLKAESLKNRLVDTNSHVLLLKVHLGGGSNKTTRNLFTGTKLRHSGGVIITAMTFDPQGAIAFSKTYFCVSKYTKFDDTKPWQYIDNF